MTQHIADEAHFKEVIERAAKVKSSLRIQGCFMMSPDELHK